jgi:hypothetical protein
MDYSSDEMDTPDIMSPDFKGDVKGKAAWQRSFSLSP